MSTRAGTPFYVAPQVLQGKYTYKCDMWSAGVILYILLCGYPPFHGENDAEILARVKVGRYKFNEHDWKGVSNEAKDLVRKLMAFDPHRKHLQQGFAFVQLSCRTVHVRMTTPVHDSHVELKGLSTKWHW